MEQMKRQRYPGARPSWVLVLSVLAVTMLACSGCAEKPKGESARDARAKRKLKYPVELRKVQSFPVEYTLSAVGSVDAFERVEVVARVAGVLDKVAFEEGNRVTTSQVLAEVDSERYRLAVEAAKANQARAQAGLTEALAALDRRRKLAKKDPGALTEEEIATAVAKVSILTAEVAQTRAALNLSEVDLRESCVRSPVDGVIQTRQAQTGQFVQRGSTITTLLRRDPLLLRFSVPAVEAARIHGGMTVRFTVAGFANPFRAVVSHVAAQADPNSRMVTVTARVDDPGREALKPGSFAEVTVPIDAEVENPVIPQSAVRPSERGFLVFLYENGVAREHVVKLGLRTADGQVEVRSGLNPGDMMILRGSDAVRDGSEVEVEQPRSRHPGSSSTPPSVTSTRRAERASK
ncbi:MAG: efflux RND transporter periplasmic adaptor subunit [Candidatus Riflebacteria bacterium]|nr:efflux RND transporter periplasmic adaptor subunit [Candidatus Riflebacteria bacterium]